MWLVFFASLVLGSVAVDLGPEAYAEPYDAESFLKMPFNAVVNVAYPLVGLYWWRRAHHEEPTNVPFIRAFAVASLVYGPVQFIRIVSQSYWSAVLDQWITLPLFALVTLWVVQKRWRGDPRTLRALIGGGVAVSIASYGLALVVPYGFEIVLGCHVALAVAACVAHVLGTGGRGGALLAAAVGCCAAFIGLKLLDHEVAALAPSPHLSGHFFSKVGDALQIHFVVAFLSLDAGVRKP